MYIYIYVYTYIGFNDITVPMKNPMEKKVGAFGGLES